MKSIGLYIDFPFCIARCSFCAFNVQGFRSSLAKRYLSSLRKEITLGAKSLETQNYIIQSIYLGGGTPSLYATEDLTDIIALCRRLFQVSLDVEITMEAHPATVDVTNLSTYREGGINRLSLGVQSFSDTYLRLLGRNHSAEDADRAFHSARLAGFTNISLDLIYGLPEQTSEDWKQTLKHAIDLGPEHFSTYALSIEEGTLFGKMEKAGNITIPSDEENVLFYENTCERLHDAGYIQYEISNFAKPGHACRHNLLYWNQEDYISFGLSAHSLFENERRENTEELSEYIATLEADKLPLKQLQKIGPKEAHIDKIIFGLRKNKGVSIQLFKNDPDLSEISNRLYEKGYLTMDGNHVKLTPLGIHFADEVAIAFV